MLIVCMLVVTEETTLGMLLCPSLVFQFEMHACSLVILVTPYTFDSQFYSVRN